MDDDEGMRRTLGSILDAVGYAVDLAASGSMALARVMDQAPDGILMDVRMPGMDGAQTLREIRRLGTVCPVIFMTGYGAATLAENARHGAVELLPDPQDPQRIFNLVEGTVGTPCLLVHPEPGICRRLSGALRERGFDVRDAADVEDALLLFDDTPRRVVVCVLRLATGAACLIRELTPSLLIRLLSAHASEDPAAQAAAVLCRHITKPFDVDGLLSLIREVTGR